MSFFGFPHHSVFGVFLPLFPSFLRGSVWFFTSAIVLHRLRGGEQNVSSATHFSALNAQCSVNILRESLYYRLVKQFINLLLLAFLLAAIVMDKHRQGIHVTTTNTNDGLFEDDNNAAVKIYKSLASTTIKRR